MKNLFKIVICYMLFGMISCDSMNSLHEDYLKSGEIIYTGIVDSLKVFPGNERVLLTWEICPDPRITKTVIYWNDMMDSLVLKVERPHGSSFPMETYINLPEGTYLFEVATKDDEGNQSLYVEKTAEIYGDKYIATLLNRRISSIQVDDSEVTINWSPIEQLTIQYTLLTYTDYTDPANPIQKDIRIENDENETQLSFIKPGDEIQIRSGHLPEDGLDVVLALARSQYLPN